MWRCVGKCGRCARAAGCRAPTAAGCAHSGTRRAAMACMQAWQQVRRTSRQGKGEKTSSQVHRAQGDTQACSDSVACWGRVSHPAQGSMIPIPCQQPRRTALEGWSDHACFGTTHRRLRAIAVLLLLRDTSKSALSRTSSSWAGSLTARAPRRQGAAAATHRPMRNPAALPPIWRSGDSMGAMLLRMPAAQRPAQRQQRLQPCSKRRRTQLAWRSGDGAAGKWWA